MISRDEQIQKIFEKLEGIGKQMHRSRHIGEGPRFGFRGRNLPFTDLNLGRREIIFLFMVARSKDGVSAKDLSRNLWVSPGAVSQFIDSLIEKNLIKREEDPEDRRGIKIFLTDYAKSKMSNFKRGYMNTLTPFFDRLDDKELEQLTGLLGKLGNSPENKDNL